MIHVGWLAPGDQWDTTMLRDLLDGALYPHGLNMKHTNGYPPVRTGCILVIPGRYWWQHGHEISSAIKPYPWVLAVRTSDEEDWFDITKVSHPNLKWWLQTPRDGEYDARLFGVGYTPHFRGLPKEVPEKLLDVFLSAQNTHQRRKDCFTALRPSVRRRIHETDGFTQGMNPAEYRDCMLTAKVAPAPSGAVSVDSFRFWEALEAHALPLPDGRSPVDGLTWYWGRLGWPFAEIVGGEWEPVVKQLLSTGLNANLTTAWWMRYKRQLAQWLVADLTELGAS